MINSVEDFDKVVASLSDEGGGDKITNQNRKDFNTYVAYLKKRGLAGSEKLDKNNLGGNILKQYIKDNPKTTLTPDLIIPLQHDLASARQWSIDNGGVPKNKLTKEQLDEFANYSGGEGVVAKTSDLNKKLDEYGLKNAGQLYDPIQDDVTKGDNVKNIHQDWIATTTAKAIARAKSLGIPPTPEAFEANKKVIFGDDKYADTVLNNETFQQKFPNYISVVGHIYKDRSNEYDKQQEEAHMAGHKVIDGSAGSRMTALSFPDDYMKANENTPEQKTDELAASTVQNINTNQ